MSATFEAEKNRKAFLYTAVIIITLLLIAIFWTWVIPPPPKIVVQDLIEINLGNFDEGFGTVQPLIKGEKSPGDEPEEQQKQPVAAANDEPAKAIEPDDKADEDAAPVVKPEKPVVKATTLPKQPATQPVKTPAAPAVVPEPKPQKPKIAGYSGPKGGTGNGATEDNGYTYQGNKPGGKGDAGDPNGKADSYGNTPGGKTGGAPRVVSGDRKIVRFYSFTADLPKATIYATIIVSPDGKGRFKAFAKNSTSTAQAYANEISQRLSNVQFDKSDHESSVVVQFNFIVN